MKASEILDKFKKVLLSEDGEVTIAEQPQEVELAEQAQPEAVAEEVVLAEMPMEDEASPEDVVEDIAEGEDKYATKEELAKALAEMKAMYESLMASQDKKEEMEVPQELSAQAPEVEVDLAAEEVAPMTHTPEVEVAKGPLNLYAQRGPKTTVDSVFNKLFK
jgi:hypothetical protein